MRCDECLTLSADLDAPPGEEAARHLVACEDCRVALEAARAGRVAFEAVEREDGARPAARVDAASLWRARDRGARPWRAARAAAVLLAVAGASAWAGASLRPEPPPALSRGDVQAAVDASLARLAASLAERDAARAKDARDAMLWVDERRRTDVEALAATIASLRREVMALRLGEDPMAAMAMPSLPDR